MIVTLDHAPYARHDGRVTGSVDAIEEDRSVS